MGSAQAGFFMGHRITERGILVCMWRTFMPLLQPKGTFKRTQHDQGNHDLLGTLQQARGKVMFHTNILSISSLYGIMTHEIFPCTRLHLHHAHQDISTKNKLTSISGNWGMETYHSHKRQASFQNPSRLQRERKIWASCQKDQKHRFDTSIQSSNEVIFSFQSLNAKYYLELSHYGKSDTCSSSCTLKLLLGEWDMHLQ